MCIFSLVFTTCTSYNARDTMNILPLIIPAICALSLCTGCVPHKLTPQEETEYARYAQHLASIAPPLRSAATQAAEISGEFYDVRTKETTRVPMSEEEQAVVRRLFAAVESSPLLPPADWYEYMQYKRGMIHPSPPPCFCSIVFLAADGTKLASNGLFESPWTDICDKKKLDSYREFKDGSDPGDEINGRYIPQLFAEEELIRQFNSLPVMDKLKQMAADCYAGR